MKQYIADLHFHSPYSRACSKDLTLENTDKIAKEKGIQIIGTNDFCQAKWLKECEEKLIEIRPGIYQLKENSHGVNYIFTNEISCIYKHVGAVRRLHLCLWAPNIQAVKKLNTELEKRNCNLHSDGRPIIGLSAKTLLDLALSVDENFLMIPAHVWTPWFALFGSKSGYNSVVECFEDLADNIYALETGLSSDPYMNRRLSQLDKYMLVSNSDAHSSKHIGREANAFLLSDSFDYQEIINIIKKQDTKKFLFTVEFFPEEGMYHYDGHRSCHTCFSPQQSLKNKNICPICKKELTIGVLNRVEELADRSAPGQPATFVPHKYITPISHILADYYQQGAQTKRVLMRQQDILARASEFDILINFEEERLRSLVGEVIASGIIRLRQAKVERLPGYDGQYGQIKIFSESEKEISRQNKLL